MRRFVKVVTGFTAFLLIASFSLAYSAPSDKLYMPQPLAEIKADTQNTKAEEIAVLKAQVGMMQDFNQHILATVYWSLGVVVLLGGLLVGFGWFTNYKIHERELASLQQELSNLIESKTNAFSEKFTRSSRSDIKQLTEQAEKATALELKQATTSIRDELKNFSRSISRLNYEAEKSEMRYWELRGSNGNVLDRC